MRSPRPGCRRRGRLLLVGGGARSAAYRRTLADLAGRPVLVPDAAEHVATGACVQAAAALLDVSPQEVAAAWGLGAGAIVEPAARSIGTRSGRATRRRPTGSVEACLVTRHVMHRGDARRRLDSRSGREHAARPVVAADRGRGLAVRPARQGRDHESGRQRQGPGRDRHDRRGRARRACCSRAARSSNRRRATPAPASRSSPRSAATTASS